MDNTIEVRWCILSVWYHESGIAATVSSSVAIHVVSQFQCLKVVWADVVLVQLAAMAWHDAYLGVHVIHLVAEVGCPDGLSRREVGAYCCRSVLGAPRHGDRRAKNIQNQLEV